MKKEDKAKMETSKVFLFIISILTILVVLFSGYEMIKLSTIEPLTYLIPSIFTEMGLASSFYYNKAKAENKTKIILQAIKEINKEDLSDTEAQIVQSLIGSIE